jgi:hypothetical protein
MKEAERPLDRDQIGEWISAGIAEDAAVEILRLRFQNDEMQRALDRAEAEVAELLHKST